MAYEPKTKKNGADPREFLIAVTDGDRRNDAFRILEMMEEISGEPAVMWGDSIIGFGRYSYRYASGLSRRTLNETETGAFSQITQERHVEFSRQLSR